MHHLKNREDKGTGLSRTCLSGDHDIATAKDEGYGFRLDRCRQSAACQISLAATCKMDTLQKPCIV